MANNFKRARTKFALLFIFSELILLGGLSQSSGYEIKQPANYNIDFDLATLLTPSGLITNLILEANSRFAPVYNQLSHRQGFFDSLWTALLALAASGLALYALSRLRRNR